jgi:hypothetical protein
MGFNMNFASQKYSTVLVRFGPGARWLCRSHVRGKDRLEPFDWQLLGVFSSSGWGYIDAASVRKEDFPRARIKAKCKHT